MRKVVGLDISLKKIAVCVLDRDGQLVWQGSVDTDPDRSPKSFGHGATKSTW
jgi:predicted NBD/HSP70 family sugar kinase